MTGHPLALPWPPSVNRYWRHVGGRVLISAAGRRYRRDVAGACLEQRAPRLGAQRLRVTMAAYPPDRRRRDLDNLSKAVLDALEAAGVFDDDAQVDHLTVTREAVRKGGVLEVTLEPLEGDP